MKAPKILMMIAAFAVGTLISAITGAPVLLAAGGSMALGAGLDAAMLRAQQLPGNALFAVTSIGDIAWGDGDDNMGGIRTQAYFCMHSDVAVHRAPATRAAATTLEDMSTIATDLGFKVGKGWKKCYTTEDKGFSESQMQGERDGRSWVTKFQLHMPGNGPRINGLLRLIQNAGIYGLPQDAEAAYRLVGSEFYPAKVDAASITTGTAAADLKGVTFSAMASSPYPAPVCTFTPAVEGASGS